VVVVHDSLGDVLEEEVEGRGSDGVELDEGSLVEVIGQAFPGSGLHLLELHLCGLVGGSEPPVLGAREDVVFHPIVLP
jgi:hypothetical protein